MLYNVVGFTLSSEKQSKKSHSSRWQFSSISGYTDLEFRSDPTVVNEASVGSPQCLVADSSQALLNSLSNICLILDPIELTCL
jgi:hypothetical protein